MLITGAGALVPGEHLVVMMAFAAILQVLLTHHSLAKACCMPTVSFHANVPTLA
jgi:hypothetical protein